MIKVFFQNRNSARVAEAVMKKKKRDQHLHPYIKGRRSAAFCATEEESDEVEEYH